LTKCHFSKENFFIMVYVLSWLKSFLLTICDTMYTESGHPTPCTVLEVDCHAVFHSGYRWSSTMSPIPKSWCYGMSRELLTGVRQVIEVKYYNLCHCPVHIKKFRCYIVKYHRIWVKGIGLGAPHLANIRIYFVKMKHRCHP